MIEAFVETDEIIYEKIYCKTRLDCGKIWKKLNSHHLCMSSADLFLGE